MHCINSTKDFEMILQIPFKRRKIIYSINSDFFEDGNKHCKLGQKQLTFDIDDEQLLHNSYNEFPCGKEGCRSTFSTVQDYEIHYSVMHQIVCAECKRNFPSYNLLDAHITEKHDSFHQIAAERNLATYQCFVEGCDTKFSSSEERNEHVIGVHKYPADFKFQSLKHEKSKEEDMDVTQSQVLQKGATFSKSKKKVPQFVCFGRGSQKTFSTRKKKVSSDISMKELSDAL